MTVTTDKKELTVEQKRLIKKYVDLLVEKKIRVLRKYLDVDRRLELRPEVVKRLASDSKGKK